MDLVGSDCTNEEEFKKMWRDSMRMCNCSTARITYDDFLLIMKGQTRDDVSHSSQSLLHVVPEDDVELANATSRASFDDNKLTTGETSVLTPSAQRPISSMLPLTPTIPVIEAPLSMDDGDGVEFLTHSFPVAPHFTPPTTPQRGASDYVSPRNSPQLITMSSSTEDLAFLNSSNPEKHIFDCKFLPAYICCH